MKIKACPFCGAQQFEAGNLMPKIMPNTVDARGIGGKVETRMLCWNCQAQGPLVRTNSIPTRDELLLVAEKWNTRGDRASAVCFNCGEAYTPHRLPSKSRRNYCPECRARGVPVRDASRDYYRRKIGKEG